MVQQNLHLFWQWALEALTKIIDSQLITSGKIDHCHWWWARQLFVFCKHYFTRNKFCSMWLLIETVDTCKIDSFHGCSACVKKSKIESWAKCICTKRRSIETPEKTVVQGNSIYFDQNSAQVAFKKHNQTMSKLDNLEKQCCQKSVDKCCHRMECSCNTAVV